MHLKSDEAVRLAEREALLESVQERHRLIGESLPGTTWTATPDGRLDYVSEGPADAPRLPPRNRLGDAWLDIVHDEDRARVERRWGDSVASGAPYEATFRVLMADGSYRWQLVRGLPQRDEGGEIVRWVGVNVDVDDRVRADAEREKFVALAEQSGDIIGITDVEGRVVYANPAALAFLETSLEELGGRPFLDWFPASDVPFVETVILPAMESQGRWSGNFRFRNVATGEAQPVLYNGFVLRDASGAKTGYATISRDIRDQQRVDVGMRALVEAGKAMHGSLDLPRTMQNIADAVVAGFAGVCSFEVAGESGSIVTYTLATRRPQDAPVARKAADVRNRGIFPGHPILRAIEDGVSTLLADVPRPFLARTGIDKFVGDGEELLDIRSLIYVPVRSRRDGRIHGVLSCGIDGNDPRGRYSDQDVLFAQEIAARAGLAFDNAMAFEHTRHIAMELQAASLPASLPASDGLELGADYRPATNEAAIGGDWYDAFALPDGRIVLTIGDVVGHGLNASIWMTKMRQSMQAAAMLSPRADVLLEVANRTLRLLGGDVFATAMAAIFDRTTCAMTVASAGHPGPVVRRRSGAIDRFEFPGLMLGLDVESTYAVHTIALDEGDTAFFYTDGLVEIDRDHVRGDARLQRALQLPSVRDAANPAFAVVEAVLGADSSRDDIAVLTLRVTPR